MSDRRATRHHASAVIVFAVCTVCAASVRMAALAQLPPVSSGTLVLQLKADPVTVTTNGSGHVTSWAASNAGGPTLAATGNAPENITFDAAGMNGAPTVRFADNTSDDQWLRGDLAASVALTDATVFWLGHYAAGAADGSGLYVYTIGTSAGTGASQLSHQQDSGSVEVYNGQTTFTGANIEAREGRYTVWRTEYRGGTPTVSHAAFADGVDLNVPGNTVGYNVNPDPHPIYVGGWQGQGFNFIGNLSELLVYQGRLDTTDVREVECYLDARRRGLPGAPDCNANGVSDCTDLFNDTAFDCNGNTVPDSCDLAGGASVDTNANGLPDECESLELTVDATNLVWKDIDAAATFDFDAVRGSVGTLRTSGGNFTPSTEACLVDDHVGTSWPHGLAPASGQAFWYLVRAQLPSGTPLTYDSGGAGQVGARDAEIAAAASSCP